MLKPNANTLATWCKELIHWKRPWCWEWWRQEETGTTEDELVGWHHWLNGHEFEQIPRVGDGLGSLACCSPQGHKESDTTERLNWTEINAETLLVHRLEDSLQLIYMFSSIGKKKKKKKTSTGCFVEIDKLMLKFMQKWKKDNIVTTLLKK